MQRRAFLVALVAALPAAGALPGALRGARADDRTARAARFIDAKGQALVAVLDSEATLPEKRREIARILREVVDVRAVGQFVLGRHWRTATEAQRTEFLLLFEETIVRTLSARFGELRGVTFAVGRGRERSEEGVMVATTVDRPGQPSVALDWLVSEASGQPLIVDVVAEGTSMRITQRSEFGSVIHRGAGRLDALLEAMRRQLADLEAREVAAN